MTSDKDTSPVISLLILFHWFGLPYMTVFKYLSAQRGGGVCSFVFFATSDPMIIQSYMIERTFDKFFFCEQVSWSISLELSYIKGPSSVDKHRPPYSAKSRHPFFLIDAEYFSHESSPWI